MSDKKVQIVYKNWKAVTAERRITPLKMYWGSTNFHQEPQWLLIAMDEDKQEERTFAMKDISSWK